MSSSGRYGALAVSSVCERALRHSGSGAPPGDILRPLEPGDATPLLSRYVSPRPRSSFVCMGTPALGIQSGLLFEAWSPALDPERQSALGEGRIG
jgi:hypothetical protein